MISDAGVESLKWIYDAFTPSGVGPTQLRAEGGERGDGPGIQAGAQSEIFIGGGKQQSNLNI